MKKHTTFRIGGDADLFVTPVNAAQVHDTVIYLKKAEVPYYVVEMEAICLSEMAASGELSYSFQIHLTMWNILMM